MSTHPAEIISVKPSSGNHAGDVVKGRTCRTLNVTRKIYIRDVEPIILVALQMTLFSIGTASSNSFVAHQWDLRLAPPYA
jgi:hypothetical protein